MSIRIYLSGRAGVEVDGELLVGERQFRGRQERVAFAYLVSERARPVTREELAAVIWPGELPPAWQTALSAIVSRLRSLLCGPELKEREVVISKGFGQYRLFLPSETWVDVEAAVSAVDGAEAALRAGEPREAFGPAVVAETISRRPFLSGDADGWVARERERLRRVRLRALECLAQVWLAADDGALAIEAASEALALDTYRERSHRLLMRAHAAAGNPAQGVRAYHDLRELLASRLGTDPSRETEAVYLELLG
ncbi:MAG: BTAD domain-containing putative transcriptional regulator [Dehalococcoidia bacterium]|nr:BTAD domain-containing putative transcriptional regulator [Dehalococcoidia bacterium]